MHVLGVRRYHKPESIQKRGRRMDVANPVRQMIEEYRVADGQIDAVRHFRQSTR